MVVLNRQWAERAFAGVPGRQGPGVIGTDLPFSFVYGGQHSSSFIAGWRRHVHDESVDATRQCRILTLTDLQTGLEVRAVVTMYLDAPGVDWTLHFTNNGSRDTSILEQVRALDVPFTPESASAAVLHCLRGTTNAAGDWLPEDEKLAPGKIVRFEPRGQFPGWSSWGACPFFDVEWGDGGAIAAVGWTGHWDALVQQAADGAVRMEAGMRTLRLRLHPGETVRSPRVLLLHWSGNDRWHAYNLFRRTMFNHIIPKLNGKTVLPPIAYLGDAFYEMNRTTEATVMSHLEAAKGLDFECFWLDAYFTRNGHPNCFGEYGFPIDRVPDPIRFPRGLNSISSAVHREGQQFLLWMGPEPVMPTSFMMQEHPEWVIFRPGDDLGTLNLGIPEAREYITRCLNALIHEYRVDYWRTDHGPKEEHWLYSDRNDPDRRGMTEIRYVEGYYRMWDELRAANPGMAIDNCCGGGSRIDLETCSRSIVLWRTDGTIAPLLNGDFNQSAIQNQVMTAALSRYLPLHVSGQMGVDPYLFRSGFNGGIAFCEDVRQANFPRELLKEAIAEGQRIRKYFMGNFYPLSEVTLSAADWCVLQYHRVGDADGMVLAFRRHACPHATFVSDLRELDPRADYEITLAQSYQRSPSLKAKGSALQHYQLEIPECPGSLLLEYKRVTARA